MGVGLPGSDDLPYGDNATGEIADFGIDTKGLEPVLNIPHGVGIGTYSSGHTENHGGVYNNVGWQDDSQGEGLQRDINMNGLDVQLFTSGEPTYDTTGFDAMQGVPTDARVLKPYDDHMYYMPAPKDNGVVAPGPVHPEIEGE